MNYPRLSETLFLTLLAALFIALAWVPEIWRGRDGAGWAFLRLFISLIAGALLVMAVISFLDFVTGRAAYRLDQINRAQSHTERVQVLTIVQHMTPEQLHAVTASGVTLDFIAGSDGSAIASQIMTPGGAVPVPFFRVFMDVSGDENTAPVRTWGEGTQDRIYARWLTDLFLTMGWATPAAGNQSARWTNRAAAELLLERVG